MIKLGDQILDRNYKILERVASKLESKFFDMHPFSVWCRLQNIHPFASIYGRLRCVNHMGLLESFERSAEFISLKIC